MSALGTLMPGFVGTTLPDWLRDLLAEGLGGVCLFGENIVDPEQTRALTDAIRAANPRAVIAIDEEGGDVTRLFYDVGSPWPGNAVLGRLDDLGLTGAVGASVGRALVSAGVNLDLAPDADVNSHPDNPVIGVRSFGDSAARVARHTGAWVLGLQSVGVAACAKHFPGHGDTAQDSHRALPVVDAPIETLRERELAPFRAAIAAGTRAIMTSHIVLPHLDDVPATFSRRILTGLLRGELGFEGLIVTDALDMAGASGEIGIPAAAVRALTAGADLLCIGTRNTADQLAGIAAAIDASVPVERIADAARRVRALPIPPRTTSVPEPIIDIARAFDVQSVTVRGERTVVALVTERNIAIGAAPWGVPGAIALAEGDPLPATDAQLVLVGRDNHRHRWVRELIDAARAGHPDALVVDMGWPGADRRYADIATFGASRAVGAALAAWLDESALRRETAR